MWRRSRAFAAAFERRKSFVLHSLERHLFDSEKWGNRGAHGSELPFSAQIKQQSAKHKVSFRFSIPKGGGIRLHMAVNNQFPPQISKSNFPNGASDCPHKPVYCESLCGKVVLVLGVNVALFPRRTVKIVCHLGQRYACKLKLLKRKIK